MLGVLDSAQRLLTPKDLSDMLGVPVNTLYRWHYTGDGPPRLHIGRHVRYRPVDVDAWLTSRQVDD
jgi:predicted DNA-binding transcriptional regulator AlpA